MNDDIFKTFINSLDFQLSDKGLQAPSVETIEVRPEYSNIIGDLTRISTDVYILEADGKTYQLQDLQIFTYEDVSLETTIDIARKTKKKKSRLTKAP